MSLPIVVVFVLGYLVVVVIALALLRAARRADDRADREYAALMRETAAPRSGRFAKRKHPARAEPGADTAREQGPLRRIG